MLGAGYNIVRANAVKVAMVLVSALVSLVVFQLNSQVDWSIGVVLGVGNMIGAWLATRFAIDKGAIWVRRFVIVVIVVSAAQLLGVFEWVRTLVA